MIKRTNKKNSNRKTISEMIKRRRVFKEQEDRKEINTMNDLVDFIDENYEMMAGGSADDLRGLDSWSTIIYAHDVETRINAHVDERDGQIYFGVDQLKYIISNPVYGWEDEADYIVNKVLDANPTEDEIEEAAYDVIDSYLMDDNSYDAFYSFDGKLPMTEKEVRDIIRDGAESLERDKDRMMDGLVSEIKRMLNKTESKRTRRPNRKSLKEAYMAGLEKHPTLKKLVSRFKEDDQWALERIIYALDANLPRLDSEDEREVLSGLEAIFGTVDDIAKLKKKFKKITFGARMWL